jgi:hypothetical protein
MESAEECLEKALELECAAIMAESPEEQLALLRAAERHLQQALAKLSGKEQA